ncbi:MAG: glycosyltransferase family 2 protein [Candidatus Zixiibacteriota bacterium]
MTLSIVLHTLFWISVILTFWTYMGYYLFLRIYSVVVSKSVERDEITPGVSIVISAHNEQKTIGPKIESCLALDYPGEKLEIIVASDGSDDRTNEIVSQYRDSGVELIAIPERNGKHYAQKKGIDAACHEIIVLTDATTFLEADSISKIVRSFADPGIGCVSGRDRIAESGEPSQGEGLYVRYEMSLRSLESRVSSLIGVSGSFFAVRKEICDTWYSDMSSDFFIPIVAYMQGFRTVLDDEAIGSYTLVKNPEQEFQRKVRTIVHGVEVTCRLRRILNPLVYGFYSFQMLSHKCMRWLVPYCLIICLATNSMLAGTSVCFDILLAAQFIFYLSAVAAFLIKPLERHSLFRIPFFFGMANLSILIGWWKYISGERYVTWDRTNR